jgi:hypothetical protein
MGNENVELLWYGLSLIKAAIFLVTFLLVALLCKRLLRRIPWKSVKRRPVKPAIVHYLGTLRPLEISMLRSPKPSIGVSAKEAHWISDVTNISHHGTKAVGGGWNRAEVMELLLGIASKALCNYIDQIWPVPIGPGSVWNSGKWFFYANSYHELGVKNRPEGDKLVLRVEKVF